MAQTKVKVIGLNESFTGSIQEIRCASGSGPAGASTGVTILDLCSFGTFTNVGPIGASTGSQTAEQNYSGEIVIEPGNPLKGPIITFHVKNTTGTSPAIVYYTDEA
tara:strand:- start:842 stop:1159 length:318 start_codon:yes stop_codon:yes gene_type:complete